MKEKKHSQFSLKGVGNSMSNSELIKCQHYSLETWCYHHLL
jgi:hypothetical protein